MLTIYSQDPQHTLSYHMQYRCSGVLVCGYADESVLSPCRAYDRVDIRHIEDNQRRLGLRRPSREIPDLVKEQTEK